MTPFNLTQSRVFHKQELQAMTEEERLYAQRQLRNIFSHEVSKITAALTKKQKVSGKLHQLQQLSEQQIKLKFEKLKQKINNVDKKRKQQLQKKIKSCKMHDQKWQKKMYTISQKFKIQDQEAQQRVKKYQEQYQNYLNNKKELAHQINQKRKQSVNKSLLNNSSTIIHKNQFYVPQIQGKKENQSYRKLHKSMKNNKNQIDQSIIKHQLKSKQLQQSKYQEVLQKAFIKLSTIQQRRQKLKLAPRSKSKSHSHSNEKIQIDYSKEKKRLSTINKFQYPRKFRNQHLYSENSQIQKSHKPQGKFSYDHIALKHQKQYKEFLQRGEILEKNLKRTKKDQILKQIKQKVNEYKFFAQRSQNI